MVGNTLAHYEIRERLGQGGMGEVYLARDLKLQRDVAIKLLPAELADHPDRLALLEREAKTVAGLNHPNIVTLFSLEEADGIRFITMERVEGATLDRHLPRDGLPLASLLDLAIPLSEALVAAHDRGVVHRDLKPRNIMITTQGRLKVLDFGLASVTGADQPGAETELPTLAPTVSTPGKIAGTIPYMAPEQLRGEQVDARSDLFALGIILYELVTGRRPFSGDTTADLTSAILRDTPAPLRTIRTDAPADLERIITRCLEKDPDRRVQTAKDMRNELELLRRSSGAATGPVSTPAPDQSGVPSIAVLPFVNRSRDEDDEYFADGLADEIMHVLSKISGLRVAARTSSFQFQGRHEDPAVVGEKLRVASLLEGTVRKAGTRLRVSVQLVKVSDGFQMWSEVFDRTLDDIFEVQDDIAGCVVKELRTTLLGEEPDSNATGDAVAEIAAAAQGRGENREAHLLFLRGRHLVARSAQHDFPKAIEYLEQALELSPDHARAWVSLSRGYFLGAGYGAFSVEDALPRARAALSRALELQPDLVDALCSLAAIQIMYDRDWDGAGALLERSLEIDPDNPDALLWKATLAHVFRRFEESETLILRLLELDPLHVAGQGQLGRTYRAAGRLEEAEVAFRRVIELSPGMSSVRVLLASVLTSLGRLDEALTVAESDGTDWGRLTALCQVHHARGNHDASDAALSTLIETQAHDAAYQIATCYAVRGDVDAAFMWLERTHANQDSGLPLLNTEPGFRSLHGDPRWDELIERLGLSE